jgi:hypothetical protein
MKFLLTSSQLPFLNISPPLPWSVTLTGSSVISLDKLLLWIPAYLNICRKDLITSLSN